jgi:hypothetical protein
MKGAFEAASIFNWEILGILRAELYRQPFVSQILDDA